MSLSLVSSEPCWALPGPVVDGEPTTTHFLGDHDAAFEEAVDRLRHIDGAVPVAPEREKHLCWTATCDVCGWEYDEDEVSPGVHLPGDHSGPFPVAIEHVFVEFNGALLCWRCCPKPPQAPGQGELLGAAE